MNEIYEILNELHPDLDFRTETDLIGRGVLDSFNITSIIAEIDERFDVQIPAEELTPENFSSAQALYALVEKLRED